MCVYWERNEASEGEKSWVRRSKNFKMHFWLYRIWHYHKVHHPLPQLDWTQQKLLLPPFPHLPCTRVRAHTLKNIQPKTEVNWIHSVLSMKSSTLTYGNILPCASLLPTHLSFLFYRSVWNGPKVFLWLANFRFALFFRLFSLFILVHIRPSPFDAISFTLPLHSKWERGGGASCTCANTAVVLDLFAPMYAVFLPGRMVVISCFCVHCLVQWFWQIHQLNVTFKVHLKPVR